MKKPLIGLIALVAYGVGVVFNAGSIDATPWTICLSVQSIKTAYTHQTGFLPFGPHQLVLDPKRDVFDPTKEKWDSFLEQHNFKQRFPGIVTSAYYRNVQGYPVKSGAMYDYLVQDNMIRFFEVGKDYVVSVRRETDFFVWIPFAVVLAGNKSTYGEVIELLEPSAGCLVPYNAYGSNSH